MLRNYLAAALRNLARNKLYSGINIVGLAVGFAAALLIALFIRDELTYEHWLPGHERVHRISITVAFPGDAPNALDISIPELGQLMKQRFPDIEALARVATSSVGTTDVRRGAIEGAEKVYWADPDIFRGLPLEAIAGDLETALRQPDGVVITRSVARKYFGRDTPLGARLELSQHVTLQVTAILEDLPSNTHLDLEILASGLNADSALAAYDRGTFTEFHLGEPLITYFRLQPSASIAGLERALSAFAVERIPWWAPVQGFLELVVVPIDEIHRWRPALSHFMRPGGDPEIARAMAAVGLLLIVIAALNFVNLMTARAMQRETEVGARKIAGASRVHLVSQFLGETLLFVTLAMIAAIALVELSLSALNGFLGRTLAFDYWRDPALLGVMASIWLCVGVLAGFYPAFVLSGFRPATVLSGKTGGGTPGSGRVRRALVVLQFAALIGLAFATLVVHRQTVYATERGLNLREDSVLMVRASCRGAFKEEILKLPEVRDVTCSQSAPMEPTQKVLVSSSEDLGQMMEYMPVDLDFFEFYALQPLAGRLFSAAYPSDSMPASGDWPKEIHALLINETASRQLGFAEARASVGRSLSITHPTGRTTARIVGVVPDFAVRSIREPVGPALFVVAPVLFEWLSIRLDRDRVFEAVADIERLWKRVGEPRVIQRLFLDDYIARRYIELTRQARLFGVFSIAGILIACLGLLGLATVAAERRTREIGVRKALGADRSPIVRMLLWDLMRPVLWANLLAWPVAAYLMHRWLEGFAYRIDPPLWALPVAGIVALLIAVATVSLHALRVASANPVAALRHE